MPRAIAATLFNGSQSVGILFHEYFEKMPLPAVAFVLMNVCVIIPAPIWNANGPGRSNFVSASGVRAISSQRDLTHGTCPLSTLLT
jgi:hypothetical protein